MDITKCDICKKKISDTYTAFYVRARRQSFDICHHCGQMIERFLIKPKLIEKKSNKD